MLYNSPSHSLVEMDKDSAFLNSPRDITFSKLNFETGLGNENMTLTSVPSDLDELPSEYPIQYVNDSDILAYLNATDVLASFTNVDVLSMDSSSDSSSTTAPGMVAYPNNDMLSMASSSDNSSTTSPSISPRSDTSGEEVRADRKIVYWDGAIGNVPDGLLTPAHALLNPEIYSLDYSSNITDNSPESYLNLDNIKVEPLEDPETGMFCMNEYMADIPSADPIISNNFSLDSSINVMAQANNGLVSASTLPLDTGFCSLPINSNATNNSPECYFNQVSIKQEPIEDMSDDIGISCIQCMCADINNVCNCSVSVADCVTDQWIEDLYTEIHPQIELSPEKDKFSRAFIAPECADITLNGLSITLPSNLDLNIPCSSSATRETYSDEEEYNSSFNSLEETKLVNASDICPIPILERNRVVEPPASSLLNSCNKSEYLRPIDKVRNDHCYTKTEIFDEPAAKNYNYFLDDVNEITVPAKRRPGRPRKSTTPVPVDVVEKEDKFIFKKPAPQKRTKKPPKVPAKRIKLQMGPAAVYQKRIKLQIGSAADYQKRILHNQAERERRTALRDSMFEVAHKCPDNVLNLTEVALASTKAKRHVEVENNFTVEVLRKTEELMKRLKYDRRLLKSKKSPTYSKMVMLLGITYYLSHLKRETEYKEKYVSKNESIMKSLQAKQRRFKRY